MLRLLVFHQAHRALIEQQDFELRTRHQIIKNGYIVKNDARTAGEAHGAFHGDKDQERLLEVQRLV